MVTLKENTCGFLAGIFVLAIWSIGLMFVFKHCGKPSPHKPVSIQDTLISQNKRLLSEKLALIKGIDRHEKYSDSIYKLLPSVKIKYVTKYIEVRERVPIDLKQAIDSLNSLYAETDSLYEDVIKAQNESVRDYSKLNDNNTLIIYNKDLLIGLKSDSINLLVKDNKKLKRKVIGAKLVGWGKTALAGTVGFGVGRVIP